MSEPTASGNQAGGRLRRTWQRVRTVPGLGRDVTVLVAVVALGVVAGTVILSQLNFTPPWSARTTLKVELADAVAVSPGNSQEVRIAGVEVGQIMDSEPTDRGTSLVTLAIEPGHQIYDNARAVLRPVNPLNQMYITLNPGGPPGQLLPDGGTIPVTQTERPVQAEEVFNKLDDRSRVALASLLSEADNALANAPETLPGGLGTTDVTLRSLQPVVEKLQQRQENIRRLVTAVSQVSTALGSNDQRLKSLVDSTQQTLTVLSQRDGELGRSLQELPGATGELRNAMNSLSNLTDQLNPTLDNVKSASEDLPDALSSLTDAVGPLREAVRSAAPVVAEARPVVAALRPVTADASGAFDNFKPLSHCLDDVTSKIAPWMYDLGGFVYNTNSLFSVKDQNGGWARGHVTVDPNSPTGSQRPDENRTNIYQQGGSPLGEYPAVGSGSCQ
jgi:phospholipid/cholesterol/gamma-HCH transport system substrate-binding protein